MSPFQRVRLLYRTVTSAVTWRMSAWPFQKTVAQELDNLQCKMLCKILPCVPRASETLDSFDRRRKRNARNVAGKIGLWSMLWASRSLAWHKHLTRGASYHFCYDLLNYHDQAWLREQRTPYVTCSRNSATAGRTSTRQNIGRPQVRWSDGVELATHIFETRNVSAQGSNAVTVSTRTREALTFLGGLMPDVPGSQ